MSDERNAADRVRPFLQQMEQSIMAARRRRLHGADEPAASVPTPSPAPSSTVPTPTPVNDAGDQVIGQPQRLRARPKRVATTFPDYNDGQLRSRAG